MKYKSLLMAFLFMGMLNAEESECRSTNFVYYTLEETVDNCKLVGFDFHDYNFYDLVWDEVTNECKEYRHTYFMKRNADSKLNAFIIEVERANKTNASNKLYWHQEMTRAMDEGNTWFRKYLDAYEPCVMSMQNLIPKRTLNEALDIYIENKEDFNDR